MDTITLASQMDNEYTDHLMSGKNIPIPFVSFVHQIQSMLYNKDPVVSLSRAFTRLENVFVTFYKTPYIWTVNGNVGAKSNVLATHIPLREQNHFYHPQFIFQYGSPQGTTNHQSSVAPFSNQQGFIFQNKIEP